MLLGTMCMPPTQGAFGNQSETRKCHTITRRQSIKCHHPIPNTRVRAVQRPQIQAVDANCAHVAPNYVGYTCGATRAYAFDQVDKGQMRVWACGPNAKFLAIVSSHHMRVFRTVENNWTMITVASRPIIRSVRTRINARMHVEQIQQPPDMQTQPHPKHKHDATLS